jgi:hypothetical protein
MKQRDENYMLVRHCVEASNVDEHSFVVDPLKIRHVTVKAGKIEDMSSFIDPATHLNLDFEIHKADRCIISEKLEKGAKVRFSDQGFAFAAVPKASFQHHGYVDYTQRLLDMRESIKKIRESRKQEGNMG